MCVLAGLGLALISPAAPAEAVTRRFTGVSAPKVSGTLQVGRTLTAKPDTRTKPSATKVTYQWLQDGSQIRSARSRTYVLTPANRGHRISVVTCHMRNRYSKKCLTSARTAKVGYGLLTVGTPTINGNPRVETAEVGETLTASPGRWTGGTKITYQWMRGSAQIPGSTQPAYTLTRDDAGSSVRVQVTGALTGYRSASSEAVIAQVSLRSFTPSIKGVARVGLVVSVAGIPASAAVSFQWLRDGRPIPNAGMSSYAIANTDEGSVLSVRVSLSHGNFADYAATLTAGVVAPPPPAPVVVSVTPVTARLSGGEIMTINGSNLSEVTAVELRPSDPALQQAGYVRRAKILSSSTARLTVELPAGYAGTYTVVATAGSADAELPGAVKLAPSPVGISSFDTDIVTEINARRPLGIRCPAMNSGPWTMSPAAPLSVDGDLTDFAKSLTLELADNWATYQDSANDGWQGWLYGATPPLEYDRWSPAGLLKGGQYWTNEAIIHSDLFDSPSHLVDSWTSEWRSCWDLMDGDSVKVGVYSESRVLEGETEPSRLTVVVVQPAD